MAAGFGYGLLQRQHRADSEEQLQASLEEYQRLADMEADMQEIQEISKKIRQALGGLGQGGAGSDIFGPSDTETQPDEASDGQQDAQELLASDLLKADVLDLYDHVNERQRQLDGYPSILPVKLLQENGEQHTFWYSSGFGRRIHPLTKKSEFHRGLDIKTQSGVPVIAAANGTVVKVGRDAYLGKLVEIRHEALLYKTLYAHLKGYADGLAVGQKVKRGQVIGYVGNTGRSTGAHLHYGVYDLKKKVWVNPKQYIFDQ